MMLIYLFMVRYDNSNIDKWFFNVDECVLNALGLFMKQGLPTLDKGNLKNPLVVGSGNAAETGKIIYENVDAVPATESTYERELEARDSIDGAVLISASGGKSSVSIASDLRRRGLETRLLTCNPNPLAGEYIDEGNVFVFPKNPEPYTYNTSTYMGMILGNTREDPEKIYKFLKEEIESRLPDFSDKTGFYFLLPKKFDNIKKMFQVKFEELFGRRFGRDFYTPQFAQEHATDIVAAPNEIAISIGYENEEFCDDRLNLPLPPGADYGTMMAVGYYTVGKIQSQKPAWFKWNIVDWCSNRGISAFVE